MKSLLLIIILKVVLAVTIVTLVFTGYNVISEENIFNSEHFNEYSNAFSSVIEYEVVKSFDSDIPKNITRTIINGQNGLEYSNGQGEVQTLKPVINEEVVIGTGKEGNYTGIMTGYGPDCSTCDGRGYTACKTTDLGWYNIITHGTHYNDSEYGSVRVLAADLSEFPCGTIVEVDSTNAGKFLGIVLDTGYDMRKHFGMGIIHFDVAFKTEEDPQLPYMTNMNSVNYNVQRWGF